MTSEQKDEFERRRMAVIRRHMNNDPRLRAARRGRKLAALRMLVGASVSVVVMLVLVKSFLLALNGPRDYAQMMTPLLDGQPADSLIYLIVTPDPVSVEIAALLRPVLPDRSSLAARVEPDSTSVQNPVDVPDL